MHNYRYLYFLSLFRCNETKQNYKTIKCMWETELAKARDSLMTPSLSKLKKEWIEQPGSIQVGVVVTECTSVV